VVKAVSADKRKNFIQSVNALQVSGMVFIFISFIGSITFRNIIKNQFYSNCVVKLIGRLPSQLLSDFKGHLSIQGYYNMVDDLILEVETATPNPNPESAFFNQNQNIGKATIQGIEFNSDFCLTEKLSLYMNYTYSYGEYKDLPETLTASPAAHDHKSIPNIPKHKANMGFTYSLLSDISFHIRANYQYKIKTIQSNPVKEIDDKTIFHSNICWENAFLNGLFFQFLVRNIFDTDDAFDAGIRTATGAYYPTQQPIEGRNLWLTVGYKF